MLKWKHIVPHCYHNALIDELTGCFSLCRVYQFSKRHALEESRQQVMLSLGARTRLEAQRLLLKGKLEWLGSSEPPPALGLEEDRISLSSITSSVGLLSLPQTHAHTPSVYLIPATHLKEILCFLWLRLSLSLASVSLTCLPWEPDLWLHSLCKLL